MGRSLCVLGHPAAAAHVGGRQQLIEVVMTASSADGERQRAQRAAMGIASSVLSVVVASALGSGANWGRLKRGGAFFFRSTFGRCGGRLGCYDVMEKWAARA